MSARSQETNAGVPDGMQRIGYDSDTHNYTFRDGKGNVYIGDEYGGELRLVSRPTDGDGEPVFQLFVLPTPKLTRKKLNVSPRQRTHPSLPCVAQPTHRFRRKVALVAHIVWGHAAPALDSCRTTRSAAPKGR